MLDAVPSAGTVGVSHPQSQATVAEVNDQIRTNNAEQLQAKNVENIQKEGSSVAAESESDRENRARVAAYLMHRSGLTLSEASAKEAAEKVAEKRATKALVAEAYRRTQANNAAPVRDAGADNSRPVDVST